VTERTCIGLTAVGPGDNLTIKGEEMKTIPITEQTLNAVIQYLASCPFVHVDQLIQAIRRDVDAAKQAKPMTAKSKEEKKRQGKK